MALPKLNNTSQAAGPQSNANAASNTPLLVKLDNNGIREYRATLFKSLDTMIGQFTTLLTMKKTQDRLDQENALEDAKPTPDKVVKKPGVGKSLSDALAFFFGGLAVYLSDVIKKSIDAIYEWVSKTFENFGTYMLDTLKVLPIIGPIFAIAHYMISKITDGKKHQFEAGHDHDADNTKDGDPYDIDEDENILEEVLGDAAEFIEDISDRASDMLTNLLDSSFVNAVLDLFRKRPEIPEPDMDMPLPDDPDVERSQGPEFGPESHPAAPAAAPAQSQPSAAPVADDANDTGLGAPEPAAAKPAQPAAAAHPGPAVAKRQAERQSKPRKRGPKRMLPEAEESSVTSDGGGGGGGAGGGGGGGAGGGGAGGGGGMPRGTTPSPDGTETNESGPAVVPTTTEKPSNVGVESLANKKVEADMLSKANQDLLGRFYGFAKEYGKPVRINSGYRPDSYQAELWVRGMILKDPNIYTPSRPQKTQKIIYNGKEYTVEGDSRGGSSHLLGSALDVTVGGLTNVKSYTGLDDKLKKWGLRRPYISNDPVHIELIAGTPALPTGDLQKTPGQTPPLKPDVEVRTGQNNSAAKTAAAPRLPAPIVPLAARNDT